jgi:hypothetical protein
LCRYDPVGKHSLYAAARGGNAEVGGGAVQAESESSFDPTRRNLLSRAVEDSCR